MLLIAGGWVSSADGGVINPIDANALRLSAEKGPVVLDDLVILHSNFLIDRTILEFEVSSLDGGEQVFLDLHVDNADPGGIAGEIEVFGYFGDGIVTPSDFDTPGEFISSFFTPDTVAHEMIDVTSLIQESINSNEEFLTFRLSTTGTDRYGLGAGFGQPIPTLKVVPEPATIGLVVAGLVGICSRRRA